MAASENPLSNADAGAVPNGGEDDVSSAPTPPVSHRENLPLIDALRGLAAPGVMFCHVHTPGTAVPSGAVFVDVFMAISGFLMTHHYILREKREPWDKPLTAGLFYTRRFFRIAPLYYAALLYLFAFYWADVKAQPEAPWWNAVQHVTFIFGFLPASAWTQMPDWSLALEMQFYLVFPLLMIWIRRSGPLPLIWTAAALAWLANHFFNLYTPEPRGILGNYMQPSVLPFKFTLFTLGMLTALIYWKRVRRSWWMLALVTAACAIPYRHGHSWLVVGVLGLSLVALAVPGFQNYAQAVLTGLDEFCRNRFFHLLAEASYSVYLFHEFALRLVTDHFGNFLMDRSPRAHWWFVFATGLVVVYLMAGVLHWAIEKPGIALGKWLCRRMLPRRV
jgi:peptidoglycan/LPS O-acetylase OafA/YrhL